MTHLVDLSKKPYNLEQDAIDWVETTIASMTLEEKIGQLFVNMGSSRSEDYLTQVMADYKFAAVRYAPGPSVCRDLGTKLYFTNQVKNSNAYCNKY